MSAQYVVGIDLGTTHCAAAYAPIAENPSGPEVLKVTQLVSRDAIEARPLLASFLYFAHESEGALSLPWDAERSYAVGALARDRAAEVPNRVIASAKSWLSHTGVDRRASILPQGAPADVEKISPVEASFRYLDHIVEAWQQGDDLPALSEQEVILTVPASFDAAARELTVEAAYAAGLENVTLLEEPQAALYAWLASSGDEFRKLLHPGDLVLVVDIGGGTTDFSAILAVENQGALELHRVAVGDHILLGGDNMDLALAYRVREKFLQQGQKLDRFQVSSLSHACRAAKERLLSDPSIDAVPVVVAGRGSALIGSALRSEITQADVRQSLLDGFFPEVPADARPAARPRTGLTQIGLPYASDAAITKHLADFLSRQAGALQSLAPEAAQGRLLHPTAVLFNGGVVKSDSLRTRLLDTLNAWLREDGAPSARSLPGADPDLAVARGAAFYGHVRHGRGLRIRGGTARAYYVGIESPMPAVPGMEPPLVALCVAPFGLEEGSPPELVSHELGVIVGEPVRFRFFSSSVRREDRAGTLLEDYTDQELGELAPIEIAFPAKDRSPGDVVPVKLRASVTAIGTLLVEAVPLEPLSKDECWKVELSVRSEAGAEGAPSDVSASA